MNDKIDMDKFTARSNDTSNKKTKKVNTNNLFDIDSNASETLVKSLPDIEVVNEVSSIIKKDLKSDFSEMDIEVKKKRLPFIGGKETEKQYQLIGGLAALSVTALIGSGFFYSMTNDKINNVVEKSNEFSMDIQRMNILFSESVLGKPESFNDLNQFSTKVTNSFNELNELTTGGNLLENDLKLVNRNITVLKNNFELLRSSADKVAEFNKEVLDLDAKIDRFISIYSRQALNQNELANVYALKISLQILNANYSSVLLSDKINETSIAMLNQYREAFKDILLTLKDGDRAKSINPIQTRELIEAYNLIVPSWTQLSNKIQVITSKSKELVDTKNLTESTYKSIVTIVNKTTKLINDYKDYQGKLILISQLIMVLSLALLLLSAIAIFYVYSYEAEYQKKYNKKKEEKTLEYINDISASLSLIQAGDLRNNLSIHEGVTSYISDSINTTIEALRTLVRQSIDMAGILETKTDEIENVSKKMLVDTEKQASDIKNTGESVIKISEAISKIAARTMKSSEEARKTVEISRDGNNQVGESLGVMQEIRVNMEETVNLMNKVSESSKLILNIVDILADINQDTEILSMNANIQATRAGEAGKPFKVVADGMKTLAERAGNENRKSNNLLNGILNDIKAAVVAIDKTRSEIEHGVTVTEKAFTSFTAMKDTIEKLAQTVEEISQEAKENAKTAVKVENEMREILTTTEDNRKSTENTVNSINEISTLAQEMAKSVKTFKIDK